LGFIKNKNTDLTDNELIEYYRRSGDMNHLSDLYQRYMDLVYGVCLQYLKQPEDAQDAVINIFEELVEKLKKHQIEFFKAWLYQVSKNHCLMILRKKKIYFVSTDDENVQIGEEMHLDDVLNKECQLSSLQSCIEELSVEQKQSVELFYLQNKCYKEIAIITQMPENKIKSYIQNGRRNLKICMDKKSTEILH
jgi:RNA polymerase sigma-70 factor (ECF subfamily)